MDRSVGNGGLSGAVALNRRQFLRGVAATGAVAGTGSLLAACSGSSSTTGAPATSTVRKRGGNLRVGLSGSSGADTLDPHGGLTYLDSARAQALYQPLLQLNASAQTEYVLAESITPKNNNPKQWIIKLRPGVTFHDGKPLTADDVIYTFRRILNQMNPATKAPFAGKNSLGPMDANGLTALDKHTVQVNFKTPYASFVDQLAYWYYLYIVPDGFSPTAKPNGTGPFKYQSFTANQRSVFTRNNNFWQSGQPYVDTVTVIDFPDNTSLQDALTTGQVDAAGAFDGPEAAALGSVSSVKVVASHTGAITPFTMRVDMPPFNDVNVRQALRLLVNRPQLIDSALDGYGVVASDVFSPYDPDFDHSLHRTQDIPQAKYLLKKSGHENLNLTLVTSPAATGMVAMATVLAEQAKTAGVTITLKNVPSSTFFGTSYLKWQFSQDFYNYSPYLPQVAQSMLSDSPFNETHTTSSTLSNLYAQANQTIDPSARKQIEHEMQAWDFANGGYILPAYIDALDAYSTKLTGYTASAVGQPLSAFDFQHWSFV